MDRLRQVARGIAYFKHGAFRSIGAWPHTGGANSGVSVDAIVASAIRFGSRPHDEPGAIALWHLWLPVASKAAKPRPPAPGSKATERSLRRTPPLETVGSYHGLIGTSAALDI